MPSELNRQLIIRTKLQRPRLPEDLIPRPRLLARLQRGLDRKLTLISAQAGAGKSTLLAQWRDKHDNDLMVFLTYLCAAIRTVGRLGSSRFRALAIEPVCHQRLRLACYMILVPPMRRSRFCDKSSSCSGAALIALGENSTCP